LVDNGCHIWDGDAYKNYQTKIKELFNDVPHFTEKEFIEQIKTDIEFPKLWGELGPIYGKQWRKWAPEAGEINKGGVDQIQNLIRDLKTNPDSRRLMVSAWNVGELNYMVLPPCHYGFQCYVREGKYLSLMWNQRSVDTFLGLPFNIASYGLLLEIIAKEVNMIPDELIGNLGDVHLYSNHIEQAKEQISREPFELPILKINPTLFEFGKPDPHNLNLDYYSIHNFELLNYQSHPTIKAPLSN
jgi:thymidylate synthase